MCKNKLSRLNLTVDIKSLILLNIFSITILKFTFTLKNLNLLITSDPIDSTYFSIETMMSS